MLKPLLRIIPQLSGNVKISSILTDIKEVSNNIFESEIRYATLQPLSSVLYQKNISADLLNSTYAFDLKKYYEYYNDIFFESMFEFTKKDMAIVDKTIDQYFRNTDFEFGVKRISTSKSGKQYAFFAPIYIDSINSIPYQFVIELKFSNSRYTLNKELRINIGKDSNRNYINKYISKYVREIDTDVVYMDNLDKTVSYYGIDLLHGGFSKKTDSTLSSLFNIQMPIQMFDQSIMNGFSRNIICMKQILPLTYLFDTTDVLSEQESQKFKYCDIQISGYYINSEGTKIDFYDFDFDYDIHTENIISMNPNNGLLAYYNGYVSNIMDVGFPSFNDRYLTKWMFSNKTNAEYCRWKLKYSSDEYPYITNMSWAFSKNQNSNYKYKEFPASFLPQSGYAKVNDDLKYDLIFPFSDNKLYYDEINTRSAIKYKNIMNSYCLNWFDVLHNVDLIDGNIDINKIKWSDVDKGYTYFNSVLYNLNSLYNKMSNNKTKIDKFAFLVYPDTTNINNSDYITQNIKFVTYTIDKTNKDNCSILEDTDKGLFNVEGTYNASISTQKTYEKAETGFSGRKYVDAKDLGIDYYKTNKLYRRSDISQIEALSKITNYTPLTNYDTFKKFFGNIINVNNIDDDILRVILYSIRTNIDSDIKEEQDLLPEIFKSSVGYELFERLPIYKATSYIEQNTQSIENTIGKYIKDGLNLYYTNIDDIETFIKADESTKIDSKNADSIYGITMYNKDFFIDKYYFTNEKNIGISKQIMEPFCFNSDGVYKYKDIDIVDSNTYILFNKVIDFVKYVADTMYNILDTAERENGMYTHYAYNPIYAYNGNIVMKNTITKTDSNFGVSSDDRVISTGKIDNNVLYVHPHNIKKILETVDNTINVDALDKTKLYGKILNIDHLKAAIKYNKTDNPTKQSVFYIANKIAIYSKNNGVLQCKMRYTPLTSIIKGATDLDDIKQAIDDDKLKYDNTSGMFYLSTDSENNQFIIVEENDFIKINSDIWKKINTDNLDINGDGIKDKYFDMFIYRPMIDTEYDQKFSSVNPTIWYNTVETENDVVLWNNEILEQLDSMLYHCFDSAYVQNREETVFYKNYSLNNIMEVKLFDSIESTVERETYYRYNCDNSVLFFYVDDSMKLPSNATIYKEAFGNSDVEYYIQPNSDDKFKIYNLNVIEDNGITYGFYILKVKMNNTSAMFNIRGFLDATPNNNTTDIDQISLLKYITVINGIDITENPEYIQDIFKQLCPFLFINLLPFMSQLDTVMSPTSFNLTTVYHSLQNSNLSSKERILKYNKQTIVSAKKQILQRYTNAITPYIKPVTTVHNQYMLKYKQINKTLLDTGKYPSLGDYALLPHDININNYRGSNIYGYSNNLETSYNTPIAEYNKYEYKHYNCSKMINLEKYFEIELNEILPYSKLIEKESEEETINIFKTYITRFINIQEEDEILFLFKKYKVNYDTSVISVTLDGSEKTYKLKYKFTLL